MKIDDDSHYLFCYTSKPNNCSLQVIKHTISKICYNLNVTRSTVRGQQCVFVNVTWRSLDQKRAGILR